MLDIGSWEFLIVIVIALIVVGPKDLPGVVRTVSQWVRRARELAREFQGGLEDIAREAELDKVKDSIQSELDPDGVVNSIRGDIEDEIDDRWLAEETAFDFEDAEKSRTVEPEAPAPGAETEGEAADSARAPAGEEAVPAEPGRGS